MLSNGLLVKHYMRIEISKTSMDYILFLLKTKSGMCEKDRELLIAEGDKVEIVLNIKIFYHRILKQGFESF